MIDLFAYIAQAVHENDSGAYVWVDLFDAHANISQALPASWWNDVFCDDVVEAGPIKQGNLPWNGKKGAFKEVTNKYVPSVRGPPRLARHPCGAEHQAAGQESVCRRAGAAGGGG